jgi:hypothetical protein
MLSKDDKPYLFIILVVRTAIIKHAMYERLTALLQCILSVEQQKVNIKSYEAFILSESSRLSGLEEHKLLRAN